MQWRVLLAALACVAASCLVGILSAEPGKGKAKLPGYSASLNFRSQLKVRARFAPADSRAGTPKLSRKGRQRLRAGGSIIPYAGGRNEPVYRFHNITPLRLQKLPLALEHQYDTCVKRTFEVQTYERPQHSLAALGIVVVVCNENLRWMRMVPGGCKDKHIYIYSKCGQKVSTLRAKLTGIARCITVTEVPHTVVTELTHVKMHVDYLRHIMTQYDKLEPHLLFLKAVVGEGKRKKRMTENARSENYTSVAGMIETALKGNWAYLNIWPFRIHTSFAFPVARGRELCTLYKRYTCEAECYSCSVVSHPVCYVPQAKSMFIVSRARIRSLPLSEYTMLAQWLTSYKDTFPGWHGHRRRYVMERLWPVVFGCDRDAHRYPDTYGEPAGCTEDMVFGSKEEHTASTIAPPSELVGLGQVTWPQPSYLSRMAYFPHVFTWDPPVSIVVSMPDNRHKSVVQLSLMSAMLANPDAMITVLVNRDLPPVKWDPVFWAGRLTVIRIHVDPMPKISHRDGAIEEEDWAAFAMQSEYLQRLASGLMHVKDSIGHLVLVRPHTIFYRKLQDVFEKRFTIGVSMQPDPNENLDLSSWFVHKDHIGTAAAILQHVKASFRHSMSATLKLTLEGCFKNAGHIAGVEVQPEAATPEDSQPVSFSAEEAADLLPGNEEEQDAETTAVLWPSQVASCDTESGLKVSLLLLPCEIFNADRDSCTPNHKTRTASIIRGRNEMVMKEMWESLQKRNRASMMRFFSFVKNNKSQPRALPAVLERFGRIHNP